jgi:hypothetical protein
MAKLVIVKELEWVRDYVSSVAHLIPKLKQLKRISSQKGNTERFQHFHGLITYFDKRSYRITLYTTFHDGLKDKVVPYTTIDILQYLAHELSHLEHWDHTPERMQLQCIILSIFMTKLKEAGYISEEAEEKTRSFY